MKWEQQEQPDITHEDIIKAKEKHRIKAENSYHIEECKLDDDGMTILFRLDTGNVIGTAYQNIPELAKLTSEQVGEVEAISLGSAVYVPATDTYIDADGLIFNLMTTLPVQPMKRVVFSNLGKVKSEKKSQSSARNGAQHRPMVKRMGQTPKEFPERSQRMQKKELLPSR